MNGEPLYLLLLLEFQSSRDTLMAARLVEYVGMLYGQVLDAAPGRGMPPDGIPAVLPVVLYNGEPPWTPKRSLQELVALPQGSPLWKYQPRLTYHLIEERALREEDFPEREGPVSLLFRLEQITQAEELRALAPRLLEAVGEDPELFEVFVAWFDLVLSAPSRDLDLGGESLGRYPQETTTMLSERIERLFEEYKEEERLKARLELREEERLKARLEVQEQVRAEGRVEGLEQGYREGQVEGIRQALGLILKARFGESTTRAARIADLDERALTSALERAPVAEHEDAVFAHLD